MIEFLLYKCKKRIVHRLIVIAFVHLLNLFQSRQELTSPEPGTLTPNRTKIFHAKSQSGGLADITVHSCATPPQHRRRLFNPKSLRSPFGQRRPVNKATFTENSSTLSGKQNRLSYISVFSRHIKVKRCSQNY